MSYYVSVGDIPQEQSERLPENGQALAKARKSGTRIYGTLPGTGTRPDPRPDLERKVAETGRSLYALAFWFWGTSPFSQTRTVNIEQ